MKIDDLVMFTDKGNYAKWFYGHMGVVESCNYSKRGVLHCRVRWLKPVAYHGSYTPISDFEASKFMVLS